MELKQKSDNQDNPIRFRIANSIREKNAIYRFRYDIFVNEMSSSAHSADHKNKKVIDDLDQNSILLYASVGSEIIATARLTISETEDFPSWLSEIFCFPKFKQMLYDYENKKIGLTTKMAISQKYRGSTLMYRLIAEMYKVYNEFQVQLSFGGGNPRLIQLYERVGWRRYTKNFTEPGYGLLLPLVFIHDDVAHLKSVHSPLYRFFPKTQQSVLASRFKLAFPESYKHINSQFKDLTQKYIQSIFNNEIKHFPPLNNLNEQERNTLIQLGAIFHCNEGDIITTVGEISNELYFLLSGTLSATSASCSHLLQPGHCFGCGINGPKPYEQQITAVTEADLLIISNPVFAKYSHLHPLAAKKLLQASLSLQLIVNNQGR
ncbi:cyclic nucleotide-binding domain-containing protein|uniref:Cyclic nucleotide-binding domain-containing protein n=1 Tax=Dendrosporobacter quercicolus TaxID=146817 RepID=A0A1G9XRY4_9FIRM|nr:cyclic nucleotide-binding domain-containing protein [Dendrosporobacter quercicolus]NSL49102.1 cyclic nucleotide-binding domain-containing protein [Dendrosporobacter quercicolus DSM 1736]SDM99528.1 hypothetical protein SAMN04488502_11027 [Dendrosporobacter quercicolus]